MKKFLRVFKFRLFRIGFIVVFVISGIVIYQNWPDGSCKDCNLILISVDTLRADHMGVYGYDKNTTPNIDKWAKDAIIFNNMRTIIPTTYPSFSMLMTSKTPFESGIYSNSVGDDGPSPGLIPINQTTATLAQFLHQSGFKTAAFINTDSLDGELTNMNKGFDIYEKFPWLPLHGPNIKEEYKSFLNINASLNWLEKIQKKRFFMWVHLMEPHSPYLPTKEFACKFGAQYCSEISERGVYDLEYDRQKLMQCRPQGLPEEKVNLFKNLYDGEIGVADKLIKQIFDKIDAEKLNKNTIVVFYGDHGEGFDHNFYFTHNHNLYDSFVKIPFIVKFPLLNKLIKENANLQNIQIMPTLLSLLGIKYNENQFSISPFTNLFLNKNTKNPSPEYMYYVNDSLTKYAIQYKNYKYIYSLPTSCLYNNQTEELYDLHADPQENKNIINRNIKIATTLKNELYKYLANTNLKGKVSINNTKINLQQKTIDGLKSLGY